MNPDNVGTLEACQRLQAGGIMTDDDKKLLTEFLDEDFEKLRKIGMDRNFDNGNDLIALKDKLVEKGRWFDFWMTARGKWQKDVMYWDDSASWDIWLFSPPIFIPLVAEFLKKENV